MIKTSTDIRIHRSTLTLDFRPHSGHFLLRLTNVHDNQYRDPEED